MTKPSLPWVIVSSEQQQPRLLHWWPSRYTRDFLLLGSTSIPCQKRPISDYLFKVSMQNKDCMKMTPHACHLSLDSYNMEMITVCHRAVEMMYNPTRTLKWLSIIAASYKLGTEIIWLVLEEERSTTPVAHPSLNKYGMLLLLFSLCMGEQLMCQKRKITKLCRLFVSLWKLHDCVQSAFKVLYNITGCCYLWNVR